MVSDTSLVAPVEVNLCISTAPFSFFFFLFSGDRWADGVHSFMMPAGIDTFFQAKAKAAAPSSSSGKAAKKKKWSKGKVKDKAQHAVTLDKTTYDRILKEAPTFRFISQSILIERLMIIGSLARIAIRHLEKEGTIKRIVHHHGQLIYSTYKARIPECLLNRDALSSSFHNEL
jgi:small subunit ribosomal protein S25e